MTVRRNSAESSAVPERGTVRRTVAGVLDGRQRDRAGREGGQRGGSRRELPLPSQGAARPLTDPDPATQLACPIPGCDHRRSGRGYGLQLQSINEYVSVAFLEGGLDVPMTEDPVLRWLFDSED